jgi:RNA polymerase sigma factor (TIGR02999 family)
MACGIVGAGWEARRMNETSLESLLSAAGGGDAAARQQIFALVYDDLRRLADRELRRRGGGVTLSPTTLLHEAYLDFHARTGLVFPDRARFMAYASRAMRGLIVDHARRRMALKRGAGADAVTLDADLPYSSPDDAGLVRIADALEQLTARSPRLAELVDLKFFCGFTFAEVAALRGVSERTVQRDWEKARLLLFGWIRDVS